MNEYMILLSFEVMYFRNFFCYSKVKLSGIHETKVWDKSHIPWLVVVKYFIPSKGILS